MANKVAVAQNMNDQAETILMRLFRGTGLEGLTAIKSKRDDIIRPLLGVDRECIETYCKEHQLIPRQDETNFENTYTRNRVRLEVLPYIQEHFNENIVKRLYDTSALLQQDLDYISNDVDEIFGKLEKVEDRYAIYLKDIQDLHPAIRSRLIRKIIGVYINHLKGVSYHHVQDVITLIEQGNHGKTVLIKDQVVFEISYKHLQVYPCHSIAAFEPVDFEIGDEVSVGAFTFKALQLPFSDRNRYTITIDAHKIKGQLNLRTRKPGDRFVPLGLNGSKKLSDFFIDKKVPARERDQVLLLCDDEHIIWVVGYRMSELYKIDSHTFDRLTFVFEKNN